MFKCLECGERCKSLNAFTRHIKKHGLTQEFYYIKYALNGDVPICLCGCGSIITKFWDLRKGYNEFINEHKLRKRNVERKIKQIVGDETRILCPKCNETFGQEVNFVNHLNDEHKITDVESLYVEIFHNNVHPTCQCGCGGNVPFNNWANGFTTKFLRGHNGFVVNSETIEKSVQSRLKGFAEGRYKVWNDGLTKQSDSRVDCASKKIGETLREKYDKGELTSYLTNDPVKASSARKKASETKKRKFKEGSLSAWNKGLTKINNSSLMIVSKKNKKLYDEGKIGNRITDSELKFRLENSTKNLRVINPEIYKHRKYTKLRCKCNTCELISYKSLYSIETNPTCFHCHPRGSKGQREVADFVRSLGFSVLENDRTIIKPLELDIVIPEKRFAIEYDGLYWHSDACIKDERNYQKKIDACTNSNVTLFNVFEDEWRDKREIVKDHIVRRLKPESMKSVDLADCFIGTISSRIARDFLIKNHILGDDGESDNFIGIIYDDDIVSLCSFSTNERTSVLNRACCKLNVVIDDWLKALCLISGSIEHELDRRYVGDFEKAGFAVDELNELRCYFTNFVNRFDVRMNECGSIIRTHHRLIATR